MPTVGRHTACPPRLARLPTVRRRAARPPRRASLPMVGRRAAIPPRRRSRPSLLWWRAARPRRRRWSTGWWKKTTLQNWTRGGGRAAAVELAVRQVQGDRVCPVAKQPQIFVVPPPLPRPLGALPLGVRRLLLKNHGVGSRPLLGKELPPGAATGHASHGRHPAAAAGDGSRPHIRRAAVAHTADGRQPHTPPASGRRPHNQRAAAAHSADGRQPPTPQARDRRPQHHTTGGRTESARAPNASTRAPLWQRRRPQSAYWRGSRPRRCRTSRTRGTRRRRRRHRRRRPPRAAYEQRGGGPGEANRRGRQDGVVGGYRPRRCLQSKSKSARKLEPKPAVHLPPSRLRPPEKKGARKKRALDGQPRQRR